MIVLARVHDRERFVSSYAVRAAELVAQFGGRYVLRAPGALSLEGILGDGRSVVISEWPDKASAQRFWDSPAYREAAELRKDICDAEVLLIEGELSQATTGSLAVAADDNSASVSEAKA